MHWFPETYVILYLRSVRGGGRPPPCGIKGRYLLESHQIKRKALGFVRQIRLHSAGPFSLVSVTATYPLVAAPRLFNTSSRYLALLRLAYLIRGRMRSIETLYTTNVGDVSRFRRTRPMRILPDSPIYFSLLTNAGTFAHF